MFLKSTLAALVILVSVGSASAQSREHYPVYMPKGLQVLKKNAPAQPQAVAFCKHMAAEISKETGKTVVGVPGGDFSTCTKDDKGVYRGCVGACIIDGKVLKMSEPSLPGVGDNVIVRTP